MARLRPRRSLALPFLAIAYPLAFLAYAGGPYCGPLCFEPTAAGAVRVTAVLAGAYVAAAGIAAAFRLDARPAGGIGRLLATPPRPAVAALAVLFVGFLAFLTLDALALYESVWKPVVLPASFFPFAPVWVLYAASFPLAVALGAAGVDPSTAATPAFRALVVLAGFPLSAVAQALFASAVAERLAPA